VKQGATSQYPARLIDVAPTVLRLLGLPPAAMDGTILADALAEPTAAEASAQQAGTSQLAAYQGALMEQSVRDIRWYQRKGIQPPPPGRIAP
jgi:arylsulfatase A-like enzyme